MSSATSPEGPMPEDAYPPILPPPPTTLTCLRTGKLVPLGRLSIESAINKQPRAGRVRATFLGLTDDEHDLTFHGGIDKAIHQYCSSHYPLWRELYPDPEVAANFVPGGFGENIVAEGWSEGNVCIGDKVRFGWPGSVAIEEDEGVLLEVSLPRQPCFKLNQRFGIKNFAPKTHQLGRTGWYYRVLEEGWMQEGMEIRVVERTNNRWSIERIQENVHRNVSDWESTRELAGMERMGKECREVFERRLGEWEEEGREKVVEMWREFRLVERERLTGSVVSFVFEAVKASEKPDDVDMGSHVRLKLPNGLSRAYSVVGGTDDRFELGIEREENSRGGSRYIHDTLKPGDIVKFGSFTQSLPFASMASHCIFFAGGIGITAFTAMMEVFEQFNLDYSLHYAVRSRAEGAYLPKLEGLGRKMTLYDKRKGERMNIMNILKNRAWNSHVYVCGPQRMIDAVFQAAKTCGVEEEEIHSETFRVDTAGDPFSAGVECKGKRVEVKVGEEETLLDCLRKAGFEIGSSCEAGNCGTCKVEVRKGRVEHRGTALSEEEKKGAMLSCVSRGVGHIDIRVDTD